MDSHGLMIGDWVMIAHNGNATHYAQVTALLPSGTIECNNDGCNVLCKSVKPIPLTPEILEKNFEKRKTFVGIFDDYFDLTIREYSDSIYIVDYHCCEMDIPDQVVTVCFVHELQHALRLCGIEKKIEL